MAKKVSSKRLGSIAGRVLKAALSNKEAGFRFCCLKIEDALALAGSVLSQAEPKKPKK